MVDVEAALDAATETRNGLPRIDWAAVLSEFEAPDGDLLRTLGGSWLRRLGSALGQSAPIHESEHFLVMEFPDRGSGPTTAAFAEHARQQITAHLPGVHRAFDGPVAIRLFANEPDYYTYVADFDPDEADYALSGGAFFGDGFPHFAIPVKDAIARNELIAHELSHAMVSHLELPLWLDKGIAVSVQRLLFGPKLSFEEIEQHRAFWNAEPIQEFWTGWSFQRPDDGNMLSYSLAELLVRKLTSDYDRFVEFVRAADRSDAGEAAAIATFGNSLAGLPEALLGPGPWRPDPDSEFWQDLDDESRSNPLDEHANNEASA